MFKKSKGFTLTEAAIALVILILSITVLTTLAVDYFVLLNSIRERFVALNLAQEGLELAIALRNKMIETGSSSWSGVSVPGNYCLSFNTSTKQISAASSSQPCAIVRGYSRLIRYEQFSIPEAIKVISEVNFGRNEKVQLNTILTKWHPSQP